MSNFITFTRRTADRLETLLQKISPGEFAVQHPVPVLLDLPERGHSLAANLYTARRAHAANSHALRATDALLEQLYH